MTLDETSNRSDVRITASLLGDLVLFSYQSVLLIGNSIGTLLLLKPLRIKSSLQMLLIRFDSCLNIVIGSRDDFVDIPEGFDIAVTHRDQQRRIIELGQLFLDFRQMRLHMRDLLILLRSPFLERLNIRRKNAVVVILLLCGVLSIEMSLLSVPLSIEGSAMLPIIFRSSDVRNISFVVLLLDYQAVHKRPSDPWKNKKKPDHHQSKD